MNNTTTPLRQRHSPSAATLRTNRSRRYARKDFWESLVPLTSAAAIALFFADGGARYFDTVPNTITGIGIVAGLVGTNLLLNMFVLAARVPFIEKVVGHDRALTLHNQLGKPVLYLIIAHFAGLIVGAALTTDTPVVQQLVEYWNADDDMFKAFLSFIGMIVVVATDIVTSDVWATAIVSGGIDTLELATRSAPLAVLVFLASGEVRANPAMTELLAQPVATR